MGFQLPSANPGIGGSPNPLAAISEAINQGVQAHKQLKQDQADLEIKKQDRQYLLEQRKMQTNQDAQGLAKTKIEILTPYLLQNKEYLNHPQVQQTLDEAYNTLGVPPPKNADGTYNLDSFKQPIPDNVLNQVMSLPIGTARTSRLNELSKQYSGIAPDMYTADAAITPKEAAAIAKMQEYGAHLGNIDQLGAQRTYNQTVLDQAKIGMITQESRNLITKNAQIQADIQRILAQANSIPQRTAILQQRAEAETQRVNNMISTRNVSGAAWRMAQGQMRDITSEYHRNLDTVNNLRKQQAALIAGGISIDDPQYTALDDQITKISGAVDSLKPTVDRIDATLQNNVGEIITATHIGGTTGNQTEVMRSSGGQSAQPIGDAPPGTPEGATNTINGRAVIVRGGKVFYQ